MARKLQVGHPCTRTCTECGPFQRHLYGYENSGMWNLQGIQIKQWKHCKWRFSKRLDHSSSSLFSALDINSSFVHYSADFDTIILHFQEKNLNPDRDSNLGSPDYYSGDPRFVSQSRFKFFS